MTNLTGNVIATGNSTYNIPVASETITKDIFEQPHLKLMRKYGITTDASMIAAQKGRGDTIRIPNIFRLNSTGANPNLSLYTQSKTNEAGVRELKLGEYADMYNYPADDSMDIQRDSLGVLTGISKNLTSMLSNHMQNLYVVGAFNQLAGNTATSRICPDLSDQAFTGDKLTYTSLLTDTVAPSTGYFAYGSSASLANPSQITATNAIVTMQDLQKALTVMTRTYGGINRFSLINKGDFSTVTWICMTQYFQLLNQARSVGADSTLSQFRYSLLEGGKTFDGLKNATYVPELDTLLVPVADHLMPRAVHSGTENANSRCVVITGAGALDIATGAAYEKGIPSFKVAVDDKTLPADQQVYVWVRGIFAGKKVQLNGFGDNAANTYDHATYVIYGSVAS